MKSAYAFFSWQVEGTNRIVERLRVGIFACFVVVVVLVWGFVWLVCCCCCLVFCFFFGWFKDGFLWIGVTILWLRHLSENQ